MEGQCCGAGRQNVKQCAGLKKGKRFQVLLLLLS